MQLPFLCLLCLDRRVHNVKMKWFDLKYKTKNDMQSTRGGTAGKVLSKLDQDIWAIIGDVAPIGVPSAVHLD